MGREISYAIYDDNIAKAIELYNEYRTYCDKNIHTYHIDDVDRDICFKNCDSLWSEFYEIACNSVQYGNNNIPHLIYSAHKNYRTVENIHKAIEILGLNVNVIEEYEM